MKPLENISAYTLDWNPITVEGFNEKTNEAIMIFNADVSTEEKINNVVQYAVGRTAWAYKNLPPGCSIKLAFDFRGQNIPLSKSELFKKRILWLLSRLHLDDQILIDIHR